MNPRSATRLATRREFGRADFTRALLLKWCVGRAPRRVARPATDGTGHDRSVMLAPIGCVATGRGDVGQRLPVFEGVEFAFDGEELFGAALHLGSLEPLAARFGCAWSG